MATISDLKTAVSTNVLLAIQKRTQHSAYGSKFNEVWVQGSVNKLTVQRWCGKVRGGELDLEGVECSGCTYVIYDDGPNAMNANTSTTIRELAEYLGISISTISNHLKWGGKSRNLDK